MAEALQPIGSLILISTYLSSLLPSLSPRILLSFLFLLLLRRIWRPKAPEMKIQCDVCEKAPATVICCADEAALCCRCDVEVHAANKLASKHQRLLLDCLAARLPRCDICQEKAAFIFCVEDRALFCRDCDEPIHVAGMLSGDHQRYLATGIRVASGSSVSKDPRKITNHPEPPSPRPAAAVREAPTFLHPSPWGVHELLQLSDYESGDKKESLVGFGELDPLADFGLLHAQISGGGGGGGAAAQVPELPNSGANFTGYCRNSKGSINALKRPRMEVFDKDDDQFFTVPDLGKV